MNVARKGQFYRHTPAFILLLLAQGDDYGASLLNHLEAVLPAMHMDTAIIYRSLQDLEEEGAVDAYWDTSSGGPARKWYRLTPTGRQRLRELRDDIAMRVEHLQFFLRRYAELFGPEG